MKLVVQRDFVPLTGVSAGELPRLVLHRRTKVPRNKALVVLIHGLGGKRYDTWQNLPHFLYADFGRVDLGLYAYPTALKRIKFWRSIPLSHESEVLADALRALVEYERIVLIGHSMGGLVARGAAAHFAITGQKKPQRRLAGIITVASPLLGSAKVPFFGALLSKDLRALAPHGEFLEQTAQVLADHYDNRAGRDPKRPRNLPQWAVTASDDFWVDRMSSTVGIHSEQVLRAAGSHTQVAKPSSREDEVYSFVANAIEVCSSARRGDAGEDEPIIMVQTGKVEDLDAIRAISDEEFGPDEQSSRDQAVAWLGVYPEVYWLFWEEKEGVAGSKGRLLGYFGVLPLNARGAAGVKAGELTARDLLPEHLAVAPAEMAAMYVGGLVGRGLAARSMVISKLRGVLVSHATEQPLEVLTRPVTLDGLRLAERRGFKPIDPERSDLGELYRAVIRHEV